MRRWVMWLVAVGVTVGLAACSCPLGGSEKKATTKAPAAKADTKAPAAK